jgi:hypothetical protein
MTTPTIPTVGLKGIWAAQNTVPYTNATVWGTGINPIHASYGEGEPVRVTGRNDDQPETHAPFTANPQFLELGPDWGYTNEDAPGTHFIQDHWPDWSDTITHTRAQNTTDRPAWNASGMVKTRIRSIFDGARKANYKDADSLPSETVSEGWVNKPKGQPADAEPSDPSQYEMQTSMTQRYLTRDNGAAVARATDVDRSPIKSRVTGQKLKFYSGEERHYDMFPFQQDQMLRPFLYRKAGTGPEENMLPNEMFVATPIQRVPPPDASLGVSETDSSLDYGYTQEDYFYAT